MLDGLSCNWLLGDGDIVWLLPGVRLLLSTFDWRLPYAISDHFGDNNNRGYFIPSPYASACLPCHTWMGKDPQSAGTSSIFAAVGCPCTAALACQLRQQVCAAREDCGSRRNFTCSQSQICRSSWAYGGAGKVTSRALLTQLSAIGPLSLGPGRLTHGSL